MMRHPACHEKNNERHPSKRAIFSPYVYTPYRGSGLYLSLRVITWGAHPISWRLQPIIGVPNVALFAGWVVSTIDILVFQVNASTP